MGRNNIRPYMPMKPINAGCKVWVRADSTRYMCDFQIYTGKVDQLTEKIWENLSCGWQFRFSSMENTKADKIARKLFVTTLESKPLQFLMNAEMAREMWMKLHSVYDLQNDETWP